MRAARATLLAFALAACRVELEGAACDSDANCPSGQGCGLDLRCSVRAASPSCSRCALGARDCRGTDVVVCTHDDRVCGTWSVETPCGAEHLACSSATCVCADPGGELTVDPFDGSALDAARTPTGAPEPPSCRFRLVTDALDAAHAWTGGQPTRSAQVRLVAPPALQPPIVMGAGEGFPLVLGSRITLIGDPAAVRDWVIEAPGGSGSMVVLDAGAALRGVTLRTSGTLENAISFSCSADASERAVVSAVHVDGSGVSDAVAVTEACTVTLEDVVARAATNTALRVDAMGADVQVGLRSSLGGSRTGIDLRAGAVTIRGPETLDLYVGRSFEDGATLEIDGNADLGVFVAPFESPISLTIDRALIRDNAGSGVRVSPLPTESVVSITRSEIRRNAAGSEVSAYGPLSGGKQRIAGGVILVGNAPSGFTFQRNLVRANLGDQVGIDGSGWRLAGDGCPATAADATGNTFQRCLATDEEIHASTGSVGVVAENNYWGTPPDGSFPAVNTLVDASPRCAPAPAAALPPCPALPAPPSN